MDIIRNIISRLEHYLKVFPVVFLSGARQAGKSTLALEFAKKKGYYYVTFDDISMLRAAIDDPIGFLKKLPKPVIIDEVQRVRELLLSIKQFVDQENVLGQFILTGSANPLLLPTLGDSLAGRMGILPMYGFSQGEILGKKEVFIPWVFSKDFQFKKFEETDFSKLYSLILKGGYPRVHNFSSLKDVQTWIGGYLQTMMDRDVRELAQIEGLHYFPDLLQILANRSGSLLNGADLARTLKISTASVHRYLTLLETLFIIFREPAWFNNHNKRIAKSPKIFISDSGVLCYLLNINEEKFIKDPMVFGLAVESFIASELLKQASFLEDKIKQYHYRDGMKKVDVVLEERGGNVVGIEIKSSETIRSSDFDGLKRFKEIFREKFIRGIVLYTGSTMIPFGDDLWAVPISALWDV
ncbi:MAG: ATP-binding protein [Chlamydiae bacterium]|nr:ATP-binding protein [Chlamydiota bacterium]